MFKPTFIQHLNMNGIPILNERLQYLESLITSGAVPWILSRLESSSHDRLVGPNHLNESMYNSESMDLDFIIEDKLQRRIYLKKSFVQWWRPKYSFIHTTHFKKT